MATKHKELKRGNIYIKYEYRAISGLTGYRICCRFEIDGLKGDFAYHEFDGKGIKKDLTKLQESIIWGIFAGNFRDLYLKEISFK